MVQTSIKTTFMLLTLISFLGGAGAAGKEGDNTVLLAMCRGVQYFQAGQYFAAKGEFSAAGSGIKEIWADNPEAQKARSRWYEESTKPFKGEPYERMMAFYYLGLLYLQENDFGNAQAAFYSAIQQDAFAEEEQYQFDTALPLFLRIVALQAQGSNALAESEFEILKALRPDFPFAVLDTTYNLILVVETGNAPRKVPDGVGRFQLKFRRGRHFSENRVRVTVDGANQTPYPLEDVFWQASSRGGRYVDAIIEGKANFARRSGDLGLVLSDMGAAASLNAASLESKNLNTAGLVLSGIGVAALLLSGKARPAVDSRYWDNLPDAVHILPLSLPAGRHTIDLSYYNREGRTVDLPPPASVHAEVTAGKLNVIWVASRSRGSKYLGNVND